MPTNSLESLAKEAEVSIEKAEEKWEDAKEKAAEQGHEEDWPYVMAIFKNMLGLKEEGNYSMMGFKSWLREMRLEGKFNTMLNEKLITFDANGGDYGNVVFLAGGAGSGKGFVTDKFMEGDRFKVRDVDEWKQMFLKVNELKNKYPELSGLQLSNPKDVFKLHSFIKDRGIKEKSLENLLSELEEDRLPNIIFDVTLKDMEDITDVLPDLINVGYDTKNINIVWVLTNYHIAVEQNKSRERIVPDDILLKTHEGAANTMYDVIEGKIPNQVNGKVIVVLNNRENTVFWKNSSGENTSVIKDFKYLTFKDRGQPVDTEGEVKQELYDWIIKNIPKSKKTKHMFPDTDEDGL